MEFIAPRGHRATWGDIDPATKKLTGSYGNKSTGAIDAEDSIITKENGFDEIVEGKGTPYWNIQKMHDKFKRENGYN